MFNKSIWKNLRFSSETLEKGNHDAIVSCRHVTQHDDTSWTVTTFLSSCAEVALKVHLSDATTHQPLSDATVEVFANHTPVARETSGTDGNIFIRFPYRLGDLLVITATKRGYVPSSAPWRPTRLPGKI